MSPFQVKRKHIILVIPIVMRFGNSYQTLVSNIFLFVGPCPDSGLQNLKNRAVMTSAGWVLDVDDDMTNYAYYCGASTFWGYKFGWPIGRVSAVFKGVGRAVLDFGECYYKGVTKVYLNDMQLGTALTNQKSEIIDFKYKPGDTLKLEEEGVGIIIINSLIITCAGKNRNIS